MKNWIFFTALFLFSKGAWALELASDSIPKPEKHIYVGALKISTEQIKQLETIVNRIDSSRKVEVYLCAVDTFVGYDHIGEFSKAIYKQWKLGSRPDIRSCLLVYCKKTKGVKIEVTVDLLPLISKEYQQRVINEAIIPYLKKGSEMEAFRHGLEMLVKKIEANG